MVEEPIDLDALLAPLEFGEGGAGADLRLDYSPTSSYQRLRDAHAAARTEDRARDTLGDDDSPYAPSWRDVLELGQRALASQSKDLEIGAWVTEALVRMHGLQGLAAGAKLISALCDRFWEGAFPQPDEEGLLARASPIGGLSGVDADGTVMQPLRRLTLFRRVDGSGLSLYQWDQAEAVAALPEERRRARYDAGTPELAVLQSEAKLDLSFLSGVGLQSLAALGAWRDLDRTLEARFGSEAPSLRKVGELLQRMGDVVVGLGGTLVAADPGDEGARAAEAGASAIAGAPRVTVLGREDALRELDRIAEYFRRTEPHSPLAYTLEEAVRRGRMSLAELLMEVLPEDEPRNNMLGRLGMRQSQS